MNTNAYLLLCVFGVGCAAPPPGPVTEPPPSSPELPACTLELPEGLEVSEGGRGWLALPPDVNGEHVTVRSAAGARARVSSADAGIEVRVPYEEAGPHRLELVRRCEEREAVASVQVRVRPLRWEKVLEWVPHSEGPPPREYGVTWTDPARSGWLFVLGGYQYEPRQFTPSADLWALRLSTRAWERLTTTGPAPVVGGAAAALLPGGGGVLLYGGLDGAFQTVPHLTELRYGEGAPTFHSQLPASGAPPRGDYQAMLAHDGTGPVIACGQNHTVGLHCEVHRWTQGSWQAVEVAPGERPAARVSGFFAFDALKGRIIVFGGDGGSSGRKTIVLGDTWALELRRPTPTWVRLATAGPAARRNGATALDPVNRRLLIWGGTADGANPLEDLWAFDLDAEDPSTAWRKLEVPGAPPPRASAAGTYDASTRRMLVGFGNTRTTRFTDLWALEL